MRELTLQLIPEALQVGITLEQFWGYDMQEIRMHFKAYQAKKEVESKEILTYCYQVASLTSAFVNMGLAGKQPPTIEEVYPDLYGERQKSSKEEKFQAEMVAYAELFNMKRQGENITNDKC